MTLHRKIVLLLLAAITLYTLVGFVFHRFLILPQFLALERDDAQKNMRRCLEALDSQINQIDLLCFDWAAWDDTYEFIAAPNADYADSNLIPESFVDNGINFIYFFRRDGSLAWGRFYDLPSGKSIPFPDLEDTTWESTDPLLNHAGRASVVRGIIGTSRGVAMIASRPILPSVTRRGELVRGTLIMGRIIDDKISARIRERTQLEVAILDPRADAIPAAAHHLATGEIRLVADGSDNLQVFAHEHDVYGADALVLHITLPRDILAGGKAAIWLSMLAAAITGVVLFGMLLGSLKWVVTDPLEQLSAHVRRVSLTQNAPGITFPQRHDEIGAVAREFNNTLQRLHEEEAELIAAEAALRTSEARLKSILDTAPDAIFTLDQYGTIESANTAASSLFGYPSQAFPGMPSRQLIAEMDRPAWIDMLQLALEAEEGQRFVFGTTARQQDDNLFPIHVSISSVILADDRHLICAVRDISSYQALQEKLARQQRLATIGEMGATVAHEIRNPLAGIKGALQIIGGAGCSAEETVEVMGAVHELVDRIEHTVNQLLHYARPINPEVEPVALRNLIEATVSATATPDAQVAIDCDPAVEIRADSRLFRQVLENIWRNACQAVPSGGSIQWGVTAEDGFLVIRLWNDAPRIEENELARVFEPFFTSRVDGSGLGLAVSLRIIEAHGGTIHLSNGENGGVQVEICMPQGE